MPGELTPPKPESVLDHADGRIKAQIAKLQAAFADDLVKAFHLSVADQSFIEGSTLRTLTIVQLHELCDCLRTTLTQPPPDAPNATDTPEEGA